MMSDRGIPLSYTPAPMLISPDAPSPLLRRAAGRLA